MNESIRDRICQEMAEAREVREQVTALLRPLRPWQRKVVLTSLQHYTDWDASDVSAEIDKSSLHLAESSLHAGARS